MKKMKFALGLILSSICLYVWAIGSPATLMNNVSQTMLKDLSAHQSQIKSNPALVHHLIEKNLVKHFFVKYMVGSILGRTYWRQATASQKTALTSELKSLIIDNYAQAFSKYNNDKIEFFPLRADYNAAKTVLLQSVIIRNDGQRIKVSYNMVNNNGHWLVYDFAVEGISMVQSYRSQFASTLKDNGVSGLLQKLAGFNKDN